MFRRSTGDSGSPTVARALLVAMIAVLATLAMPVAPAAADGCDHFASPSGSDADPGTEGAPVHSVARLIEITGAGEEGCLPAGSTFEEPIGSFIVDQAGGAPGSPARIRTADREGTPAVVKAAVWLQSGVHDLTFERIRFTDSPGNDDKGTMLVVDGDRITFRYTEMTWRRGICLNAGHRDGYVVGDPAGTVAAEDLVVEHSRIHDCGNDPDIIASLRQPGQSGVHGLYLVYAPNARIRDNYIYDNVDRGLQFWPDVDGAIVEHNVFDGNSENINVGSEAAYGHFSEGNLFKDNIVTNATLRSVNDPPWGPGDTQSILGNFPDDGNTRGNAFVGNCIYQPEHPDDAYGGFGFSRSEDVYADPLYVDRAAKDFTLQPGSPCAGKGPRPGTLGMPEGETTPEETLPEETTPPKKGEEQGHPPVPQPTRPLNTGGTGGRLSLSFERRPYAHRGSHAIRFSLASSEDAEATITVRLLAGPGSEQRLERRKLRLNAGPTRLRLRLGQVVGDPSKCSVLISAVDSSGVRVTLRSRLSDG